MTLPSITQAKKLLNSRCKALKKIDKNIYNFFGHYLRVAENAQMIAAHTANLDPKKAYILGLLHDYGQADEQKGSKNFHGLSGYESMLKLGYDEVAQTCLTHSFFENDNITPQVYHSYNPEAIMKCAKLLSTHKFDDYDRLIHLSDLTATYRYPNSIEERFIYLKYKYHISSEQVREKQNQALQLKHYFDEKCHEDVYKILGIAA